MMVARAVLEVAAQRFQCVTSVYVCRPHQMAETAKVPSHK